MTLLLQRKSEYNGRLRSYNVELDGKVIGQIGNGERKSFDIDPGSHTLRIRVDWTTSNTIAFKLAPGKDARFSCSSNLRGAKAWFGIVYVLLLPHRYLKLESEAQ